MKRLTDLRMTYFDLIDLIEQQASIIKSQSDVIIELLNENAEKENMINELMREHTD